MIDEETPQEEVAPEEESDALSEMNVSEDGPNSTPPTDDLMDTEEPAAPEAVAPTAQIAAPQKVKPVKKLPNGDILFNDGAVLSPNGIVTKRDPNTGTIIQHIPGLPKPHIMADHNSKIHSVKGPDGITRPYMFDEQSKQLVPVPVKGQEQVSTEQLPADATGEDALKGLPEEQKALVRKIANDDAPLPSPRSQLGMMIQSRVAQYDPTWSARDYDSKRKLRMDATSGKIATNLRSLNTVVDHLKMLDDEAEALHNSTGAIGMIGNKIKNTAKPLMGDASVNNFDATALAASTEIATALKGAAPTVSEIDEWKKKFNHNMSPEQFQGVIHDALGLLNARFNAIQDQYSSGMGKKLDFQALTPRSRQILQTFKGRNIPDAGSLLESDSGSNPTPPMVNPQVQMPIDPKVKTIRAGEKIKDAKGVWWKFKGGDPTDPKNYDKVQ